MNYVLKSLTFSACAFALLQITGCAAPTMDVKVQTMSMQDSYKTAVGESVGQIEPKESRIINPVMQHNMPYPVVAVPDVRMAYITPWKDDDGLLHYGSWVAVPVDSFKWVMPTGVSSPMDGTQSQIPPNKVRSQ